MGVVIGSVALPSAAAGVVGIATSTSLHRSRPLILECVRR
jgi:hypothetical protein